MRQIETIRARAVVQRLVETDRPGAAIRALARSDAEDGASAFERYAAGVLRSAGALQLTEPGRAELRLRRPADGQYVRLIAPGSGAGPLNEQVRVLEDAVNRLLGITGALSEGIGAHVQASPDSARTRRRAMFESQGMDYPLWSDTVRGANVVLPPLANGEQPTEAFFNEIDWRSLDVVANCAHSFFQAAILANMNQRVFGLKAPAGSEWDVRTRLASILEGLGAPLHLSYRFDCNAAHGIAAIRFSVPSSLSFPSSAASAPGEGPLESELMDKARTVYALRLCALLSAACFGAGRVIEHAFAMGADDTGRVAVSCAFERSAFVRETLPAIDAGSLSDTALRFSPERVAQILRADQASFTPLCTPAPTPNLFSTIRPDPAADTRPLSGDLQRLFHAKRVCDVDTAGYLGGEARAIDEAKADSADAVAAAIARLEGVAADLEASLAPPEAVPDARPLHCEDALSRVAVALLDDELSVAAEAEAFLNPEAETRREPLPDVYYYRAPDALFHAHVGLADLYRKLGDARGAEAQADRCIALAPTTPAGYALKADALAGRGRFKEAANVIVDGLRVAVAENDQALLLHDLAQLFWRMGRAREASALHIRTARFPGIYAENSRAFVREIAGGADMRTFIRENAQEADRIVADAGIFLVSSRLRQALIARAAFGLSDMQAPRAAAPYAALLAKHFPTNRAIATACDSIRFGIGR